VRRDFMPATKQPVWKFLANLGDAHPLEYGGLFVYEDETGVYPPEMERLERVSDDDDSRLEVRRVVLEPCTWKKGVLSDNPYHPGIKAWFADKLQNISASMDYPVKSLRDDLCSKEPLRRASAWRAILDYHGWENGDSYPLILSQREAKERYAKKGVEV